MLRRTVLAAGLALSICASGAALADALDDVMKAKVLKVAVPQDFPPFGSVSSNLKPIGYDVEVAKLIADKLGVKAELVPVTSANRIPYLQTKKVDLVISSLGKNPDREKVIDFSQTYAPFFSGVFAPDTVKISKPEELAGKTIGVTRGALEDPEITKILPATATIKRFEDNNTTMSAFLSGQVELVATGNVVAAAIAERDPKRSPKVKFILSNSPCYIGLNKGEAALLAKVNDIVSAAKKGRHARQALAGLVQGAAAGRPLVRTRRGAGDRSWATSSISARSCRTGTCCCAACG
jgi:polar amino acid transport system substrate-binding protein